MRGVAFPFFYENFCCERFCDLHGAVGRAGVDDDDLSFAVADERLHALKSARDGGFFVVGDDDDRQGHGT